MCVCVCVFLITHTSIVDDAVVQDPLCFVSELSSGVEASALNALGEGGGGGGEGGEERGEGRGGRRGERGEGE